MFASRLAKGERRDYRARMARNARTLLTEAMTLPESDRLELASELLASVAGPADPDWEKAWLDELYRRTAPDAVQEADALEWKAVRAEILRRLARP